MVYARPASFSLVYAATRAQLREGALAAGTQLLVNEHAALHGVSATPVREALAKLAGERLVEDRERQGYFVPLLSLVELMGLLELLELYLLRAIDHGRRRNSPAPACADADPAALWRAIAAVSGNPLLVEEAERCIDRLAVARRLEAELFGSPAPVPGLAELLASRDWTALGRQLRVMTRTSCSRAGEVAHAMARSYRETIVRK